MKIAYLTNCFGIQSHTFIRREIVELGKLGVNVELLGIRKDVSDKLSSREKALVERTHYLYPLSLVRVVYLNLYWALLHPRRYWPTFWKAAASGESKIEARLKLFYHFLVAPCHAKIARENNIEHIHAHFLNVSSTIAMYVSLLTGIPYSITVHSAGTRNAPHIIGIPMKLKYAQFLIMISHYNIDYFDALFPCRDKSVVVRCGMDLEQYPFSGGAEKDCSGTEIRIVAVGRMVEKKGFQYLIEAAGLLLDQGQEVRVEILGFGPQEAQLKQLTEELGLEKSIIFRGPASSDEVCAAMLGATVVAVPSVTSRSGEMEGIPVVLMEAMALGVPVISTKHSGIPELVRNGETGIVVDEKDPAALASALLFMVNHPAERAQWAGQARRLIESEFNITVVARQRRDLFIQHRSRSYESIHCHSIV